MKLENIKLQTIKSTPRSESKIMDMIDQGWRVLSYGEQSVLMIKIEKA